MSDFDPDRLLEPVSDKDPSGEDLSDTLEFRSLQDAAGGQAEQVMGVCVIPVVPPDWERVMALGTNTLARSKDIRIGVPICWVLLHREGFPGLASKLTPDPPVGGGLLEQRASTDRPGGNRRFHRTDECPAGPLYIERPCWCRCAWLPLYAPGRSGTMSLCRESLRISRAPEAKPRKRPIRSGHLWTRHPSVPPSWTARSNSFKETSIAVCRYHQ